MEPPRVLALGADVLEPILRQPDELEAQQEIANKIKLAPLLRQLLHRSHPTQPLHPLMVRPVPLMDHHPIPINIKTSQTRGDFQR